MITGPCWNTDIGSTGMSDEKDRSQFNGSWIHVLNSMEAGYMYTYCDVFLPCRLMKGIIIQLNNSWYMDKQAMSGIHFNGI